MPVDDKKFVPVMLTAYDENMRIDFQGISMLVDFYIASGAKGLFANCLSSEMYNLTTEERLQVVQHVVRHADGRVPVVATGSFGPTMKASAGFIKRVYDVGIEAVVLVTSQFAEQEEGDDILLQRFEEILNATGNIPLGLYECPVHYKRTLNPATFKTLLNTGRFVYHKDTSISFDKVKAKLAVACNSSLQFFDAHSPNAMYSLQTGARGMSCIAGNFYPEIIVWLCNNAMREDKKEEVRWLQNEITKVDPILHQLYPISAKYFLHKRGLQININSRACPVALTMQQQHALDEVYNTYTGWCEKLGIETKTAVAI